MRGGGPLAPVNLNWYESRVHGKKKLQRGQLDYHRRGGFNALGEAGLKREMRGAGGAG